MTPQDRVRRTGGPAQRLPLLLLPLAIALVLAAVSRSSAPPPWLVEPLAFAAGAGLVLASLVALVARPPPALASAAATCVFFGAAALASPTISWALVDAGLLVAAALVGGSLGRRVAHAGHVLAASAVAAAADIISISTPNLPTHAIARSERALSWVAIATPVPGTAAVAPMLGVGDLVFAALILAVGEAHAISRARLSIATGLGLAAAGAASALLQQPVPALVTLGAAYVACVPEFRSVRRADRRATAVALAAFVVATAWASLRGYFVSTAQTAVARTDADVSLSASAAFPT